MPIVYNANCTRCSRGPKIAESVAGYVKTGVQEEGVVTPAAYIAFRRPDGRMVCLPHPVEQLTLQENGGNWDEAKRTGNLLWADLKVCTHCGMISKEYRVMTSVGRTGFLFTLAVGALAFITARLILESNTIVAIVAGVCALVGSVYLVEALPARRWRGENQENRLKQCGHCGESDFIGVKRATKAPTPCPYCKTTTVEWTAAGIS